MKRQAEEGPEALRTQIEQENKGETAAATLKAQKTN